MDKQQKRRSVLRKELDTELNKMGFTFHYCLRDVGHNLYDKPFIRFIVYTKKFVEDQQITEPIFIDERDIVVQFDLKKEVFCIVRVDGTLYKGVKTTDQLRTLLEFLEGENE
jgi:hypothetical protein